MVTSACRSIEPHAELSLERTGDFGHLEDFELIVNLNVIVALETQTAFAAGLNFAHIVLEVLQAGELAVQITTLSRKRRALALRRTTPSRTRQPAMRPTLGTRIT